MKKLLFTCDGDSFSHSAFDFAVTVNKYEKILLKGIFMPSIDYSRLASFAYANSNEGFIPIDFYEQEEKMMDKSITQFESLCRDYNILYSIYKNTAFESLQGLLDETRFSDLILVESKYFFSAMDNVQPNIEMNQLLHNTECPVLLIPEKFKSPENIVFAYYGEASCMSAIKHLHTSLKIYRKLPLTVVFFSSFPEQRPPFEKPLTEYIKCYYNDFVIKVVDSKNSKDLNKWISGYEKPLIVTGSYSRSSLSRVFKKSFISMIITRIQFPIFIFS
jgi:hypothetical protein